MGMGGTLEWQVGKQPAHRHKMASGVRPCAPSGLTEDGVLGIGAPYLPGSWLGQHVKVWLCSHKSAPHKSRAA